MVEIGAQFFNSLREIETRLFVNAEEVGFRSIIFVRDSYDMVNWIVFTEGMFQAGRG